MTPLVFLKLGGSLITDKNRPHTPRTETLARLAAEIARARRERPELPLLLGHGSGSFGHVPAKRYGTRQGVHTAEEWNGFVEVWREAQALNRLVMEALGSAGLPAIALAPSASVSTRQGQVVSWDLTPLQSALEAGLVPVVFGDVIFDAAWGGTILSTEDLFAHLARPLKPQRILLAGIEPGVWADFPACTRLRTAITPDTLNEAAAGLAGSAAADVTGGMASKVGEMIALAKEIPGLEALIFSGETPGAVYSALQGESVGTRITARLPGP